MRSDLTMEELRARNARLQLFVFFIRPSENYGDPASAEGQQILRDHLNYWVDLEKDGKLFAAGPLDTEGGSMRRGGLAIIRAESRAEAERLAAEEPFQKAGWRVNEVHAWTLNEGLLSQPALKLATA
jgi:uncharacterized protein